MKKNLLLSLFFSGILCHAFPQSVKLSAIYDANNAAVRLNWNMINSNVKSGYILLKSADGITWTELIKDRMLRNYTNEDLYIFNDRFYFPGKSFYRLKIYDGYNNTIALSTIVTINTGGKTKITMPSTIPVQRQNIPVKEASAPAAKTYSPPQSNNNSWMIYPNPASDIIKLAYKGSTDLKGVVNVQIQDANGKIVIKFRSGSMYKLIQIPISNLQKGIYFIQVNVLNEVMVSQKFLKQ